MAIISRSLLRFGTLGVFVTSCFAPAVRPFEQIPGVRFSVCARVRCMYVHVWWCVSGGGGRADAGDLGASEGLCLGSLSVVRHNHAPVVSVCLITNARICVCSHVQGMVLYWASSGLYTIAQNLALNTTTVKRWLGVPEPPPLSEFAPPSRRAAAAAAAMAAAAAEGEATSAAASMATTATDAAAVNIPSDLITPSSAATATPTPSSPTTASIQSAITEAREARARHTLTQEEFLAAKREKKRQQQQGPQWS